MCLLIIRHVSGSCLSKKFFFLSHFLPASRWVEREEKAQVSCCCCSSCHCSLSSTAGVSQPMPGETKGKRTGSRAKQTLHDSRAIQLQCFCKTFLVTAASYILLWKRILGTSSPAPIALHAGWCDKAAYLLVENVNKQEMSGYEFSFLHIHFSLYHWLEPCWLQQQLAKDTWGSWCSGQIPLQALC